MSNLYYVPNGNENTHMNETRSVLALEKPQSKERDAWTTVWPQTLETNAIFHFP